MLAQWLQQSQGCGRGAGQQEQAQGRLALVGQGHRPAGRVHCVGQGGRQGERPEEAVVLGPEHLDHQALEAGDLPEPAWPALSFTEMALNAVQDIRKRAFARVIRLPMSYFDHARTGQLVSRITNDTNTIQQAVSFALIQVAGGIVLLLMSLHMLVSGSETEDHVEGHGEKDPMDMAYYPLAVPYILNPVGIAVLVIASSQLPSILSFDTAILIAIVLLVGLIDLVMFRNIETISKFMDPAKLGVTEAVFGVLLAALAVELMFHGLVELGVITAHLAT